MCRPPIRSVHFDPLGIALQSSTERSAWSPAADTFGRRRSVHRNRPPRRSILGYNAGP